LIIKEAEPCKYAYIVFSGELMVTKMQQEDKPAAISNPGKIFENL